MSLSTLNDDNGSLNQEEEEAYLRTMDKITNFEDMYKTYTPPISTPNSEYNTPPANSILKNKCWNQISTTTLKSQKGVCILSPSTLISKQVRSKIRKLNQESLKVSSYEVMPKDLTVTLSHFRVASGQIVNNANSNQHCCSCPETEYRNNGDVEANCEFVPQPMNFSPANYTGFYDQTWEQNCFNFCSYNQEPNTYQDSANQHEYYGSLCESNESMKEDSSSRSIKQREALYKCQGPGECSGIYRENYTFNQTQSEKDTNDSECCCDQDTDDRMECWKEEDQHPPKKKDTKDDCTCSPLSSPATSRRLPNFLMKGRRPTTSNYCPPTCNCCPPTSDYCPPTSNCCPPYSPSGNPPANIGTNCVDVKSSLCNFKQAPQTCMGTNATTATGMGFLNVNRYSAHKSNGNTSNRCYCPGYVNNVLQNRTVYAMDYQPMLYGGNNFYHRCGTNGILIGGAVTPSSESYCSYPHYPADRTVCGSYSSSNTGSGLCGDLCGGQSNGIYSIGDLCCNINTQNCYPLSQLSPGYCNTFQTCCMPCTSTNCSPYECYYEMPGSPGGYGGMDRCCSKTTSCNLSQSSSK